MLLLTNIIINFTLFLLMLVHPWNIQPKPTKPQRSIVRKARAADGFIWLCEGNERQHIIGLRFKVEAFYRSVPGGEL